MYDKKKLFPNNKIGYQLLVQIHVPNFKFIVTPFLRKKVEKPVASLMEKY